MSLVALIRPDDWNFPLLVHVLGATLLVGGLVTAVTALLLGWSKDSAWYSRVGFRALVIVALPAWFLMRIGAGWIYSREGWSGNNDPSWLGIGFFAADLGGALLLVSIILTGLGVRQLGNADGQTSVLVRIGSVIAVLVLLAYVVAVWAMSGKPD
jgi:hypothetical protein